MRVTNAIARLQAQHLQNHQWAANGMILSIKDYRKLVKEAGKFLGKKIENVPYVYGLKVVVNKDVLPGKIMVM